MATLFEAARFLVIILKPGNWLEKKFGLIFFSYSFGSLTLLLVISRPSPSCFLTLNTHYPYMVPVVHSDSSKYMVFAFTLNSGLGGNTSHSSSTPLWIVVLFTYMSWIPCFFFRIRVLRTVSQMIFVALLIWSCFQRDYWTEVKCFI